MQMSATLRNRFAWSHKIAGSLDIIPLLTESSGLAGDFVTLADEKTIDGTSVAQQG